MAILPITAPSTGPAAAGCCSRTLGETYTIATYASVSGLFDNVTPGYVPTYGATALTVTAIPEPSAFFFAGVAGLIALVGRAVLAKKCFRTESNSA